jgi:RND family efflux transporter MFP subunit
MFSRQTVIIMTRNLILLLVAAIAATLSGCAARAAQPASQGFAVAVARPQTPQAIAIYEGPGSVGAAHTYQVSFEIPGRIAFVNYDVGDHVAAGAVLASIDSSDYAAQAAAASAQAAAAPSAAQAQLARAQAAASLAHANVVRYEMLYSQGDVAAQVRDNAVAADRDAQAQLDAARAQITQSGAAVASARLAQITLGKTSLISPADTIVQKRAIEPGDTALPGTPAFTLISAGAPDVLVAVPERVLGQIHVGTKAVVIAGTRSYAGETIRLEPAADESSRTAQVRIHVARLTLAPGTVVTVRIGVARAAGLSIPLGAVMTGADGRTSVELYDPATKTLASRAIQIMSNDGDRVVVQGLAPSDEIVTQGQYEAKAGDRVHLVNASSSSE